MPELELQTRRTTDALRAVDGVVDSFLRHNELGGRRIANLAATIAIENSGAGWGSLLLDDGDGLSPTLAIQHDLSLADAQLSSRDHESLKRAEDTAELVVGEARLAAPIVLDGRVRGVLYLRDFTVPPGQEVQQMANSVASRIASLLKNAELLEALDRTQDDLNALAQLSEHFAAGQLGDGQLEETLRRAVTGTGSELGVLGILSPEGLLEERYAVGLESGSPLQKRLEGDFTADDVEAIQSEMPKVRLFEPLSPDVLNRRALGQIGGFVAVARTSGDVFGSAEVAFLRAIANLLSGALARRDYFRRASEDPLTSTGSRFALQLKLAEAEARSLKTGIPFSVLLVDVDRFKNINDDYGHLTGDEILKDVADILRARLRALDSVSRYGGDEFVVLLPDTELDAAANLAAELRQLVANRGFTAIAEHISVSIGVAEYQPGQTAADALRQADVAMYRSKETGRDRVTKYSPSLE